MSSNRKLEATTTYKGSPVALTFSQQSRAWYADSVMEMDRKRDTSLLDSVNIAVTAVSEDGHEDGIYGEFVISFHDFATSPSGSSPAAKLVMFDDAWEVFSFFEGLGLFERLKKFSQEGVDKTKPRLTPERLCEILTELGFVDITMVKPDGDEEDS